MIGREVEIKILESVYHANEAQFIALYGRRRVGKTYLVNEYFHHKGFFFDVTGIKQTSLHDQLENFITKFSEKFYPGMQITVPKSWRDAFSLLTNELKKISTKKKVIVFLDELPWLAKKRSKFLLMLDYFWNTTWSHMPNMILVICGSAASWMLEKIVNNKGGLHNRLTQTLLLQPFNLQQTKQFLTSKNVKLTEKQILDIYMVTGGIPHYLNAIPRGKSVAQIINALCFHKNGLLLNEFDNLFESLFATAALHIAIVRTIAKKHYGMSRNALLKALKMKSGGKINMTLNELTAAGFIQSFTPFGKKKKSHYYRIVDEYTLFYLHWIEPVKSDRRSLEQSGYWQKASRTPKVISWAGYAFEGICYKHIKQIATALDLDQTLWYASSWQQISKNAGAQIDLLFDRDDGMITLCEIKYSIHAFLIDKTYALQLIKKLDHFKKQIKVRKALQLAMITTEGIQDNTWSQELVECIVTLKDLFAF
jgi:uncharacterized protein